MLNYFDKLLADYKIIYNNYNKTLRFMELPFREQLILVIASLLLIKVLFSPPISLIDSCVNLLFSITLFFCIPKKRKEVQKNTFQEKEAAVIDMLKRYGVEYSDFSKIQGLIAYVKDRISRRDPFLLIKKAISIVLVVIPVLAQILSSISAGTLTLDTVLALFSQIMLSIIVIITLLVAVWYLLDPIIYRNRIIGQSLIDDLTELALIHNPEGNNSNI